MILFNLINRLSIGNKCARIHFSNNVGVRIGIDENILENLVVKDKGNLELYECSTVKNDNFIVSNSSDVNINKLKYLNGNDDPGPKNLSFSSLTSTTTIQAYNETFTLTFVTDHSVGIGAYLVVLGRRIIMHKKSVLLLTGYKELNKLNGVEIYKGNEELGGVDIIERCNVSQLSVSKEYEGLDDIFRWIEYWHASIDSYNPENMDNINNSNKKFI